MRAISQERRLSMLAEEIGGAHVATERVERPMPRGFHHREDRGAGFGRAGQEPAAQAVGGECRRVDPGHPAPALRVQVTRAIFIGRSACLKYRDLAGSAHAPLLYRKCKIARRCQPASAGRRQCGRSSEPWEMGFLGSGPTEGAAPIATPAGLVRPVVVG
jgi:hypothetical protein